MSSDNTVQNIIFTNELQRPGAALGSVLASNSSGVFQLDSPPADGKVLVSDSGQVSGVNWGDPPILLWSVTGSVSTPLNPDTVNRLVMCNSSNTMETGWDKNGLLLSSVNSALMNAGNAINDPKNGSIIASSTSQLIGSVAPAENGAMFETCIMACNNCDIQRARSDQCFIFGSIDSDIITALGSGTGIKGTVGCDTCSGDFGRSFLASSRNVTTSTNQGDLYNSYFSCENLAHSRNGDNNTFLSSTDVLFGTFNKCLCKATFADINHSGVVVLSDDDSTTRLTTLATNSFVTRFIGGVRFYTNSALTTYADLAPGSGTWVPVSDRNAKENIIEVNYDDILGRVKELPVYNYNFKGNPREMKCIGAMAQDWHSIVTPLETYTVLEDDPNNEGKKIEDEKDAKNKLGIEDMDSIGVCLASIKSLDKRILSLIKINELKRQKIKILENKIKEIKELRLKYE